jgi:hypothetical protein
MASPYWMCPGQMFYWEPAFPDKVVLKTNRAMLFLLFGVLSYVVRDLLCMPTNSCPLGVPQQPTDAMITRGIVRVKRRNGSDSPQRIGVGHVTGSELLRHSGGMCMGVPYISYVHRHLRGHSQIIGRDVPRQTTRPR